MPKCSCMGCSRCYVLVQNVLTTSHNACIHRPWMDQVRRDLHQQKERRPGLIRAREPTGAPGEIKARGPQRSSHQQQKSKRLYVKTCTDPVHATAASVFNQPVQDAAKSRHLSSCSRRDRTASQDRRREDDGERLGTKSCFL